MNKTGFYSTGKQTVHIPCVWEDYIGRGFKVDLLVNQVLYRQTQLPLHYDTPCKALHYSWDHTNPHVELMFYHTPVYLNSFTCCSTVPGLRLRGADSFIHSSRAFIHDTTSTIISMPFLFVLTPKEIKILFCMCLYPSLASCPVGLCTTDRADYRRTRGRNWDVHSKCAVYMSKECT